MKKILLILFIALCFSAIAYCDKSIDELNPDFEGIMASATKEKPRFGEKYKYWTMFAFADIHSDQREFSRLLEFYKKYENYFDEIYCAGDLVMESLEDDFTFWGKTPGHEKVLMCIGNHDVKRHPDSKKEDQVSEKETYDYFFKPYIKNWNCVYEEGHTYYYKDYDKGVRLITVDCMLHGEDNEVQFKWFDKVIKDALNKKLAVLIVNHCPLDETIKIKSNFTQPVDFQSYYWNMGKFQDSVDNFMEQGGEFICWFGGHIHADSICYNKDHPKQLNILMDAANKVQCEFHSDIRRPLNTRHEDLANAFIVNLSLHQIKLIRIGANVNTFLQQRNHIVIDYKTFEIISEN